MLQFTLIFSVFLSCLGFMGCNRSAPQGSAQAPILNQPYFQFKTEEVTAFEIQRSFPGEEPWKLQLRKDKEVWKITQAPITLLDQGADSALVEHLLETLSTFAPKSAAPRDQSPGALESMGLFPPRAKIRWGTNLSMPYELTLGDTYGQVDRFALFGSSKPMLASGAALQMLHQIQTWEFFRHRLLLLGKLDDWDFITVGDRRVERFGVHWESSNQLDVSEKVQPILENFFHQRIKRFVDDPTEQAKLEKELKLVSSTKLRKGQMTLTNRKDQILKLTIFETKTGIWVRSEERRNLFFEAFPALKAQVEDLERALTQATSTGRKSSKK